MNILKDELNPKTFGEFIDSLLIANLRMWHAQEIVYDLETLSGLSREQMFEFLKEATWLNLMRNTAMDAVDSSFAEPILARNPGLEQKQGSSVKITSLPIWEES